MNSLSILANRVHWTRFVLNYTIRVNHRRTLQAHKKTNTLKKLSSNFKRYTIPSYSQSLPLTRSRALSHSHTLIPSLLLRRHRCLSLPLVCLHVAQSFSLSGWQTTSQSKDSLFFLGVLVICMHCTWCLGVQSFAAISAVRCISIPH